MAVKIKFRKPTGKFFSSSIFLRSILIVVGVGAIIFFSVSGYYYNKYKSIVDERLKEPLFANTAKIYAAAREVRPGQKQTVQIITGLSEDANRTKRRLLTYDEIPPNLVHAIVAIEDRRFFEHGGVDYIRI